MEGGRREGGKRLLHVHACASLMIDHVFLYTFIHQ